MIIHECIETFDKNVVQYVFFSYDNESTCFPLQRCITKNANVNGILFFNFVYIFNFDWKFYGFKISLFEKYLPAPLCLAGLQSAGFTYLSKHHLKHSLLSLF